VLDRSDAGPDRDLDPLGPVGVGGDEDAVGSRLLHGRPNRRGVELDDVGPGAAGQDRAGDDELDQVGAAGDELADPLAGLGRRSDDAEPQVWRQHDVAGEAGHLAAAAGRRDVGAGALHPRTGHPAAVDRVAQRDVDERPVRADVPDAREPSVECRPRVADAGHRLLGRARRRRGHACELHVADEVAVAVDQPRGDREPGQVDDPGAVRDGIVGREDGLDAPVLDQQLASLEDLASVDVEESRAADDGVLGHGGRS
jgi:hypothetical protein